MTVKMSRVLFFQASSFHENWETQMIHAVAVAQRMGLGATELVITPRWGEAPKKRENEGRENEGRMISLSSLMWATQRIEGDEWKDEKDKKTVPQVEEFLIQLYALRVADVEWEAR